jgi:hypothetical protein
MERRHNIHTVMESGILIRKREKKIEKYLMCLLKISNRNI